MMQSLVSLLDDEDDHSASFAMAELLSSKDPIDRVLREIQESPNPRLRRRGHQMQSILTIRRRRQALCRRLKRTSADVFIGLCELHFLWYDQDPPNMIEKQWTPLRESAMKFRPDTMEKLAYFMRKNGFITMDVDDIDPDFYCIGVVLEESIGADFILCAIAMRLAAIFGLDLRIIRFSGSFALLGPRDTIIQPAKDWQLVRLRTHREIRTWKSSELLRLAASMLFYCSIGTDSFRYTYTIGNCLAGMCELDPHEALGSLPYPLNTEPPNP
jgi:hypothetical protein